MENIYSLPDGLEPHFTRYVHLIQTRPTRNIRVEKGYEIHHILPKSMGGNNSNENKIKLTYREHFIAHLLLWKCYGGSMILPFLLMQTKTSTCGRHERTLTSRQTIELKEEASLYRRIKKYPPLSENHKQAISKANKGKGNPAYGKRGENAPHFGIKHSEEDRKKISEGLKGKCSGEKNGFYGRHHSEETKNRIREKISGVNNWNAKKVMCIETGIIFDTITEANKWTKSNKVGACCRGLYRTVHGLHWKYLEILATNLN